MKNIYLISINFLILFLICATNTSYPQAPVFTDRFTITPLEQTGPQYIIGDVSWNGEIHACDDIHIEANATLKLNPGCILHMLEGKKIVVKREADLLVNNAIITNDGEGLWTGIEVWGDNLLPSNSLLQGYLSISNNSEISNAECAIKATRINEQTGEGQPEYSGGLVIVSGSSLINNQKAAWFFPYSGDDDCLSTFINCLVEVNDNIIAGTTVEEFIELNAIDGVSFVDINMKDERTNISMPNKPTGIYAISSIFGVYGQNNAGPYTTSFSNLRYGIRVLGIQPTDHFTVREAAFYNNLRGIYTSATTGPQINLCYFQPWENASIWVENYGLYLDECTGYQVEENLFENNNPTTVYGNGLVINNSGTDANQIYRNTFKGLDYGIIAQNKNRHSSGLTGLCIKCNDFDNCNNDIVITTDMGDENPELGIAASQGASSSNPEDMAGNLFFIEERPDGDFDDINNEANHITYYYPLNAPGFIERLRPVDYTENTVNVEEVTVYPDWTFENGCPSNFGGGGGGGTGGGDGREELLVKIAEADQKTDSIQTILNVLVDAGNTEGLHEDVYYSTPPETMEVYTEMMNASPYLSDTVVSAAIQKEDVLIETGRLET
ncbi:MAG: hypothetical protein B6I19_09480 [Bacteroidetes bacterium 4572_114]|nr:MAG: hypothetical protein B6I19_09480 [Bacteroidetes bacterium 4572_114]